MRDTAAERWDRAPANGECAVGPDDGGLAVINHTYIRASLPVKVGIQDNKEILDYL
jgi:hypothetical protein